MKQAIFYLGVIYAIQVFLNLKQTISLQRNLQKSRNIKILDKGCYQINDKTLKKTSRSNSKNRQQVHQFYNKMQKVAKIKITKFSGNHMCNANVQNNLLKFL